MRKIYILFFVIALMVVVITLVGVIWLNNSSDNLSPQTVASFPLDLKWQINLGYVSYDQPANQDGLVILTSSGYILGTRYAIDAITGQIVWQQGTQGYEVVRCLDSRYIITSSSYALRAFSLRNGSSIWQKERASAVACSDETVFFSIAPRDSIRAVDIATGKDIWRGTTPLLGFSDMVYDGETEQLIASTSAIPDNPTEYEVWFGRFYLIDAHTGKLNFSFAPASAIPSYAPANVIPHIQTDRQSYLVNHKQLFLSTTIQDIATGQVVYKDTRYDGTWYIAITENAAYRITNEAIIAIDPITFDTLWVNQEYRGSYPISEMTVMNHIGYILFSDATLRAIDLVTGQEVGYWQSGINLQDWPVCIYPDLQPDCVEYAVAGLTASDNMLFVSLGNGTLYAFGKP